MKANWKERLQESLKSVDPALLSVLKLMHKNELEARVTAVNRCALVSKETQRILLPHLRAWIGRPAVDFSEAEHLRGLLYCLNDLHSAVRRKNACTWDIETIEPYVENGQVLSVCEKRELSLGVVNPEGILTDLHERFEYRTDWTVQEIEEKQHQYTRAVHDLLKKTEEVDALGKLLHRFRAVPPVPLT